jgi:hypothetical protein
MINRRQLFKFSAASCATGSLAPLDLFAQTLAVTTLSSNTALITGAGSNVLVRKAANGDLLVVDGGLQANARELRRTIESAMDSKRITTPRARSGYRERRVQSMNCWLSCPRSAAVLDQSLTRQQ